MRPSYEAIVNSVLCESTGALVRKSFPQPVANARSATAVIAYNIVLFITVVILEGDFDTADQGLDHGVGTLLDITEDTDFRIKRIEMVERVRVERAHVNTHAIEEFPEGCTKG